MAVGDWPVQPSSAATDQLAHSGVYYIHEVSYLEDKYTLVCRVLTAKITTHLSTWPVMAGEEVAVFTVGVAGPLPVLPTDLLSRWGRRAGCLCAPPRGLPPAGEVGRGALSGSWSEVEQTRTSLAAR